MVIGAPDQNVAEGAETTGERRFPAGSDALVAIVAATGFCGLVLLFSGHDPVLAYGELARRTMLRPAGITGSIVHAGPILITAIAVLIAVRAGLWNIGVDGQVLAGAFTAAVVAAAFDGASVGLMWIAAAVAGLAAGALWALIPALLRARFDLNEIVSSIMLNYVAAATSAWLVKGPFRDTSLVTPQTPLIPREARLPELGSSGIHVGLVAALGITAVLAFFLVRTVTGFELRAVGENSRAAWRALIPVRRLWAGTFIASGAIAALAGVNDILATKGTFQAEWNPQYGLSAFVVVFLARRSVWGLVPAALFVGALAYGADVMPRAADISPSFFSLYEGVLLGMLAVPAVFSGRRLHAVLGRGRRAWR